MDVALLLRAAEHLAARLEVAAVREISAAIDRYERPIKSADVTARQARLQALVGPAPAQAAAPSASAS